MNNIESAKGEIVMYQPDETIRLEVRVEDDLCSYDKIMAFGLPLSQIPQTVATTLQRI